ncbi:hypothetical protein DLAC_01559 [Tieghemostelium lacteum]|uniref:PH domain-containing protein n=1 Tax=Tieghemostelium lacteum TaxID=361077 RepID=A0A152A629_TIELA|nr:hypothetical protein DLAC_01559 [Tieghemostelium lacteum]|eukprot:KYR01565.1 hypothetical protein DLAC_01559 [Tieghemostelium lacteum]
MNNQLTTEKVTKQGYLYKKGKINKSWQKRWCILNKDSKLYYHRTPNEKYSGYIQLSQTIIKTSDNIERDCTFEIITGDRIYLFSADNKYELDDWIRKLFTHSIVQQENDLIERAEFIIREEALKKSNKEDEFLKIKHSIYDHYLNGNNSNSISKPINSKGGALTSQSLTPSNLLQKQQQQQQNLNYYHHPLDLLISPTSSSNTPTPSTSLTPNNSNIQHSRSHSHSFSSISTTPTSPMSPSSPSSPTLSSSSALK